MVGCRVSVYGFSAPSKTTGGGRDRGWELSRDRGAINPLGSTLRVLRRGQTGSGPPVNVLVDAGLLLRWILVRGVRCQRSGHRGLLRSTGRWNRGDVVDAQVNASRRLLLLGWIVSWLLESRGQCRKGSLKLRLERLS